MSSKRSGMAAAPCSTIIRILARMINAGEGETYNHHHHHHHHPQNHHHHQQHHLYHHHHHHSNHQCDNYHLHDESNHHRHRDIHRYDQQQQQQRHSHRGYSPVRFVDVAVVLAVVFAVGVTPAVGDVRIRTCNSQFEDVASRTVRADVVFEGSVRARHETFSLDGYYNATMRVRRVLKGELPREPGTDRYRTILVGLFGPQDRQRCVYDIGIGTYVIFLDGRNASSLDPKVPFYRISSFPEPSSKSTKKIVRKYRCDKCAKPPKARVIPREQEVQRGKKINLKCKISGRPLPVVRWLKDNKPIADSGRVRIRNSKKSSRLQIKRATIEDEGVYTCEVTNVVGTNYRDVEVSVAEPFETPAHAVPCPDGNDYCLNGGKCFQVKNLGGRFCICNRFWAGDRCIERRITGIGSKRIRIKEAQKLDRVLTGLGLGITFLVFCIIVIAAYLLSKKKRKDYRRKQEERRQKAMHKNTAKGSYSAVPMEATIANEKQKEIKPVMRNTTTQTDHMMNAPFLGVLPTLEEKSCLPERRRSLPSQLNRQQQQQQQHQQQQQQAVSDDLPGPRYRLAGTSDQTTDVDGGRRQPNVAVVNAVVESDPEQHSKRSSPSQSSKTESAHGHLDQNGIPARGLSADDTDPGSKDDELSLDLDQRSDYDNQPPSDMEVNLESEADVHGLDASGDELDGSAPQQPQTAGSRLSGLPDLDDSSDSDSDDDETGSSIGEEQALFQQLQSNPRVRALQENASLSDRDSSVGNLSWDEFQHQPSFTVDPRQYAFNPYALDNDIMRNPYFPDAGSRLPTSQAKSLDEYDHELPYDPDPDATVV